MTAHGHFHWNELNTRDAGRAKEFYAETVGWTFDEMDMGDGTPYYICKQGDALAAGIFTMQGPDFEGIPEHWMSYLAVDDVDAAVAKAKSAGGEVINEPFDVLGTGRIAKIKEPGGAVIGLMTPAENG